MRKAFTLIELLIVIAIIAILALIAVPNFLEAQVRAKVSRVYADMRTLATGVEAYAVDWGRPPIGQNEVRDDQCWSGSRPSGLQHQNWIGLKALTTPLAYITSIPTDPFTEHGGVSATGWTNKNYKNLQYTSYACADFTNNFEQIIASNGYTFCVASPGPARMTQAEARDIILGRFIGRWAYDATNGTMSVGAILRTNKGIFTTSDIP
jgi:prepilin-type N-terminal cleavage/methylation domain-containing protein